MHNLEPSGVEFRLVLQDCRATIGQVGNIEHENLTVGKAGKVDIKVVDHMLEVVLWIQ